MAGTPFFAPISNASVQEILEAFADRATIEQDFHDVKEVWGSGQQQVRNIWNNLAVYNLNLWMHTLVELWAWDKSHEELCDRSDSPWDDTERRPSHANRRKALRRQILRNELSTIATTWSLPQKIIQLTKSLMALGGSLTRGTFRKFRFLRQADSPPHLGKMRFPVFVGAAEAMYPGHWGLPAGQRINCRCTTISILDI